MATHREAITSFFSKTKPPALQKNAKPTENVSQPSRRLSNDGLKRTVSDISSELSKEAIEDIKLPAITEVENTICECCGMMEEFTPEYVEKEKEKYLGKWICGLCAEAVKGEMDKNGNNVKEALNDHINVCVKFNKFGRAYPVLYQAEAMKELLKKSSRDNKNGVKSKGIARSSSCIPAITKDMNDFTITK